jgi:AcrR family transcriptional regulator
MSKRAYLPSKIRQEQVLAAAASLIADQGLAATTMPAIAMRADLSVGGLYRHFKSKEALICALIDWDAEHKLLQLEQAIMNKTPEEQVVQWAIGQLTNFSQSSDHVLKLEILSFAMRNTLVAQSAQHHDQRLNEKLSLLLKNACDAGSFAEQHPEEAVEMLAIFVDGIATRAAVAGIDDLDASPLIRPFVAVICRNR